MRVGHGHPSGHQTVYGLLSRTNELPITYGVAWESLAHIRYG
jgi:hypothetical protein